MTPQRRKILIIAAMVVFILVFAWEWHAGAFEHHIAKRSMKFKEPFWPTSVVWSPDGKYIASTGTHTRISDIWDVDKQEIYQRIEQIESPSADPHNLAWSPDGRYLAICTGSAASILHIWDMHSRATHKDFSANAILPSCYSPAFSPDGKYFAVAYETGVTVFERKKWSVVARWESPREAARRVSVIKWPTNDPVIVMAENGYWEHNYESHVSSWRIFDTQFASNFTAYTGWDNNIISLTFSPDGTSFATGTTTGVNTNLNSVRVWSLPSLKLLGAPIDAQRAQRADGLEYMPDGKYLLAATREKAGRIFFLERNTFSIVDVVRENNAVWGISIAPDSSQFAVAAGHQISIWSMEDAK